MLLLVSNPSDRPASQRHFAEIRIFSVVPVSLSSIFFKEEKGILQSYSNYKLNLNMHYSNEENLKILLAETKETSAHIPGKLVNIFNGKMVQPFLILLRKSVWQVHCFLCSPQL